MNLSNFQNIDPHLLLGIINTTLRNSGDSLDDLCHLHDIDRDELENHLGKADYEYKQELNQFR